MRIAVMAAGAVGGYFGGRMAAAGHDVAFIARGAHRDAIRRDGLKIVGVLTRYSPATWSRFKDANVDITDEKYARRHLEEIPVALGHVRHDGEHA